MQSRQDNERGKVISRYAAHKCVHILAKSRLRVFKSFGIISAIYCLKKKGIILLILSHIYARIFYYLLAH